jgi:hypothetical protein
MGGGNNSNNKKSSLVQGGGGGTQTHQASCSSCASILSALLAMRMKQQQGQGQKNTSDKAEFDVAYQGLVDHTHEMVQEQLCQAVKENLFSLE